LWAEVHTNGYDDDAQSAIATFLHISGILELLSIVRLPVWKKKTVYWVGKIAKM